MSLAGGAGQRTPTVARQRQCDEATVWRLGRRDEQGGRAALRKDAPRSGRPQQIAPLQRAQLVELAGLEPIAQGLPITPWSSRALARAVVADGMVAAISPRTIRQILREVDLRPHRTRYWKPARVDDQFRGRAEQVRWCDAKAVGLAPTGRWVVCVDERPTVQILERTPIRRAIPGAMEPQACEDVRQGTLNGLVFVIVHTGRLEAGGVAKKDAEHSIQALRRFRQRHRWLRGVCLIQDGDPRHPAARTRAYFRQFPWWWRPRFTPAHASWLNQAELLTHAFSDHDLTRGAWHEREECIAHINASWPAYNRRYASPFEWTWTHQKMRKWFATHAT